MPHLSYAKDYRGVADVFLRAPARYAPLMQFIESVMTGPSALSAAEREMIATHVSRLNGCAFCLGAHKATLLAMDVDLATIELLESGGLDAGALDGKLLALVAFAGKLTKAPGAVAESDIDALKEAGWDEQSIEDATNVVALITGVGDSTGAALARRFTTGGYRVAMIARTPSGSKPLKRRSPGPRPTSAMSAISTPCWKP